MKKLKQCYYWEGTNAAGEKIQGIIDTSSAAFAKAVLHKQGFRINLVKKQSIFTRRITQTEISIFYRQTATLLKAGIPLIQAFAIVSKGQTHQTFKWLIEDIKKQVENGFSFSEALRQHPAFFNELSCHLIAVGEKSGKMEMMLERVVDYQEKIVNIKKKIRKALFYPLIVLFIACLVTYILLTYVVPQFESVFRSFGASLPLLTCAVISLSAWFRTYGLFVVLLLVSLVYSLFKLKKNSQFTDRILLSLPILGIIVSKAIIARFSRTLAITFGAGLPIASALKAAATVTVNKCYIHAIDKIRGEVYAGQSIHLAMRNVLLFPDLVVQMIAIGEESGSLELMLEKIADFYEEEVGNAVEILNQLLEPIIMTILGLIVGGLVIAMYLPIFKLGTVI